MWKPDLVILNSAESFESWSRPVITLYCEEYDNTSNQSGRCIRSYPLVVFPYALTETTRCVFDVTDFPFDSQKCHIDLGPWYTSLLPGPTGMPDSLSTPYFVFHPNEGSNETDMSLSAYTPSSQWEVEKVTRERRTRRAYMGRLSEFMLLRYTIHMNRRPTFFINTLLLPCLILTLLTVLSVFLPVESGEKISLGITIMLAQVVNLLILSSILPASSLHFPVLGRYFLVTIGLIGLSLVYNCAITNYFYNDHISILRKLFDRFFIIISKDPGENVKSANFENNTKNLNETGDGAYENEAVLERSETGLSNSRCSVLKGSDSEESDQSNARRKISASCDMGFGIFMLVFIAVIHVLFFWKHVVT
ncbi:neuronal acetylcholine receptor subunit alpha-7-like isoform X2 [Symsagittifera roscoffensis]|uniref:neuronal acetylcholine receptor subunit alpha-7-like isoform X2 n=1 Tax=Symsagittifera roscoffensis TaxID=84072 RepID=UPI00307C9C74